MPTPLQRSRAAFPAACNGEFNLPDDLGVVISRGDGCEIWTADGRRMLDFSMGWGSVLVGHANERIAHAVATQVRTGSNFAYVNEQSLMLAEEIIQASPACEQVRICASGTEATMYCLRLARSYIGRQRILKFEGAYHGAHDIGVASMFPAEPIEFPKAEFTTSGVDPGTSESVLIAPFNDLDSTCEIADRHRDSLAAIIVEPLQRCLSPVPGFLDGLRQWTRDNDCLLVFDEVVTGFRLAYGGAQEYYGVVPDLVAYGKALGGGLPIGAFGGRHELMELVREERLNREKYAWMASTFGGNPISAAAANAALRIFRHGSTYPYLHQIGNYLRTMMRNIFAERDISATILGDGPLAQVAFTTGEVRDYRSSQHRDASLARRL